MSLQECEGYVIALKDVKTLIASGISKSCLDINIDNMIFSLENVIAKAHDELFDWLEENKK